jgi:hypothetical protein
LIDANRLIGIDRVADPPRYIPEVVLTGEDLSEFLKFVSETKGGNEFPIISWSRAKQIIGRRRGAREPEPDGCVVEMIGAVFGRNWYAIYG